MEETTHARTIYLRFCMLLLLSLSLANGVVSLVYTVGDSEGWDSGVDFGVWSQKYNFTVGDVLVFKYIKTEHNAYEVTETTFRSCDASTGVLAKYETGNDQVNLTQPRKYWFICNVAGHCLTGMRFGINVNRITTSNLAPLPVIEPPPPQPGGSNGSHRVYGRSECTYLVIFGILLEIVSSFI